MSEPSFLVWLDPGKTTGVAWYDVTSDSFGSAQYDETELVDALSDMVDAHPERIAIGWELYIVTSRSKGTAKYSLGEIAKVEALCEEREIPILKGQPSSSRMADITKVFLRRQGWYRPGLGHANDAACHLFRHVIRMRPVPEKIRTRLPVGY